MDYEELVQSALARLGKSSSLATHEAIAINGVGYAILALAAAIREATKEKDEE